ncbi:hypothetical protein FJY68_11305 [candidate division WOR-3 bacterium]|uniref:DNA-binding protein n=1 Tax=candidate division WOR-3 bacterium TaxID=2052148 RepID=A0A938BTY8_UNCW3|nr:hypothetical protein [candidate division WOR-3 bacterium]
MKKYIALGLTMLVAAAAVVGCGGGKAGTAKSKAFGKAIPVDMTVTSAKAILDSPHAWEGKDVLVAGKITSECPSGCWFWVKDETGEIYVDIHPTNLSIPQRVGKTVRAMGKVILESGQPSVVGYGLELK